MINYRDRLVLKEQKQTTYFYNLFAFEQEYYSIYFYKIFSYKIRYFRHCFQNNLHHPNSSYFYFLKMEDEKIIFDGTHDIVESLSNKLTE